MRTSETMGVLIVLLTLGAGIWALLLPETQSTDKPAAPLPRVEAPMSPRSQPARPKVVMTGYWDDPSIQPEIMARAFAPPPKNLPPEARPQEIPIDPPNREWNKMKREQNLDRF